MFIFVSIEEKILRRPTKWPRWLKNICWLAILIFVWIAITQGHRWRTSLAPLTTTEVSGTFTSARTLTSPLLYPFNIRVNWDEFYWDGDMLPPEEQGSTQPMRWPILQPGNRHEGRLCDEDEEPRGIFGTPFLEKIGRAPSRYCTVYDLTLRNPPLGDAGAKHLAVELGNPKRYRKRRMLRKLVLQHQDITSAGAVKLAQLLAASCSLPTAIDPDKLFILDLRGNPIATRGIEQLRKAVTRLRENQRRVIIYGGGTVETRPPNVIKIGPVEIFLNKKQPHAIPAESLVEWQLPPSWSELLRGYPADSFKYASTITIAFLCGILCGSFAEYVPFRWVGFPSRDERTLQRLRRLASELGFDAEVVSQLAKPEMLNKVLEKARGLERECAGSTSARA